MVFVANEYDDWPAPVAVAEAVEPLVTVFEPRTVAPETAPPVTPHVSHARADTEDKARMARARMDLFKMNSFIVDMKVAKRAILTAVVSFRLSTLRHALSSRFAVSRGGYHGEIAL